MGFSWARNTGLSNAYQQGAVLLGQLNNGQSYVRVHFRWGVYGDTTDRIDIQGITNNIISFGLVTTYGDGTETPPAARTASFDAAPPTLRWIYWETRQVVPVLVNTDAGVIVYRDTGSSEPTDTKGQVLATGVPGGQTLNLWASWEAPFAWHTSGTAQVWLGASVLYKTP